jgi:hypothetical protein
MVSRSAMREDAAALPFPSLEAIGTAGRSPRRAIARNAGSCDFTSLPRATPTALREDGDTDQRGTEPTEIARRARRAGYAAAAAAGIAGAVGARTVVAAVLACGAPRAVPGAVSWLERGALACTPTKGE